MSALVERAIALFALKDKRERLLFLAGKPARWDDFCDAFLHDTRSLDPRSMTRISSTTDHARLIAQLGATPAAKTYCISSWLDDRELSLVEALRAIVGRQRDVLVFCPESERAYYENHEGEQFVLRC